MPDDLVRRLRNLLALRGRATPPSIAGTPVHQAPDEALRERVRALEADVAEVRNRVNGLLFLVAGTVLTQLLLRLLA